MTKWEEDSSFELPEDESWRGDQHAPQGSDGDTISTWQPGMTADEADDLNDEEDDKDLEVDMATEDELAAACVPLAKRIDSKSYLVACILWTEQNNLQEIEEVFRITRKEARRLREELLIEICTHFEAVSPSKTIDMDDALGIIFEEGSSLPCKNCGDIQARYSKYCTCCGTRNPDFCDELFQRFYGHCSAAEAEHACPENHKEALEAHATGYCMVCGLHFPTRNQNQP